MNVDLHTHTYPASDCSRISYRDYIAWCVDNRVEAIALTNHGDISDNRQLGPALAAEGVLLIDGVEISTLFGDFVVFSPDLDYLETLRSVQEAPRPGAVPDHAAVVWVHPGAGGGRSGSAYYPGIENMVAGVIDAVEVYNGSWLDAALRRRSPSRSPTSSASPAPAAATPTIPRSSWSAPRRSRTRSPRPRTSSGRCSRAPRSPSGAGPRRAQALPTLLGGTMWTLEVQTRQRVSFVDISRDVAGLVADAGDGAVVVYVPHTTAGVTINEDADPSVRADLEMALERLVPRDLPFTHLEGNSDAHTKASLMGSSVTVPVVAGTPQLGTWQGIYFAEFDGPRRRRVLVTFLPA